MPINGSKQWISIYGKKKDNPVLLYLHGGPGASTSSYDYAFTRKWADAYTVVTWDQRNCGKSRCREQHDRSLTYDFTDGRDYSLAAAQFFNPYYSLKDYWKLLHSDFSIFEKFLNSEEFGKFSLLGREDYPIPYYNINGDRDYQTNFYLAQSYFDSICAPRKEMYMMKDTTHGLLESKSEAFSEILHQIAKKEYICSISKEESL